MSSPPQIQVANLDHLGLVAGMIDAIGIVEKINHLVGTQPGEKVSPGQAVKAMILNGLYTAKRIWWRWRRSNG